MKVLLLTHFYPSHFSGVPIAAGHLAEMLGSHFDYDITWVASSACPPPSTQSQIKFKPMRSWNPFDKRFGFPYPLWDPRMLFSLFRLVRATEVVHLHDFIYIGNFWAFFFAKILKKPVLLTQHVGAIPFKNALLRWTLSAGNRILGRCIHGSVDRVIFISESVKKYFWSFCRYRKPPLFIPNGLNTTLFSPIASEARSSLKLSLGLDPKKPTLLFVGRFVEKKGLLLLQALASHFSEVQWLFVGWGPLDPSRWGLKHIRVIGGLEAEKLVPYYRAADLLILPSVGEGFPLVVQESMGCGTPALIEHETLLGCPGAEKVVLSINGSHGGSRASERESAWIIGLQRILDDRAMLEHLRPKVRSFAEQYWSWESIVNAYREVFSEIKR